MTRRRRGTRRATSSWFFFLVPRIDLKNRTRRPERRARPCFGVDGLRRRLRQRRGPHSRSCDRVLVGLDPRAMTPAGPRRARPRAPTMVVADRTESDTPMHPGGDHCSARVLAGRVLVLPSWRRRSTRGSLPVPALVFVVSRASLVRRRVGACLPAPFGVPAGGWLSGHGLAPRCGSTGSVIVGHGLVSLSTTPTKSGASGS